ncbi:unnamed protein product [Urochloa humidicola]
MESLLYEHLEIIMIIMMVPNIISELLKSSAVESVRQSDDIFALFCGHIFIWKQCLSRFISDKVRVTGLDIYIIGTGVRVTMAYALLLLINWQYGILVPFLISLVSFIAYLWNEIQGEEIFQQHGSGSQDGLEKDSEKISKLKITVVIPYFMLFISAIYGDGSPALSHFLLFSCCTLGILALMYSRLAVEVSSALKPALESIQKVHMVMLFIAVHTVVAEWLGEVTTLVFMPELIAGLVWFSTLLHGDTLCSETEQASPRNFKGLIFDGYTFIPLGAGLASLTSTYACEGELLASWYREATAACGVAGCMPYLSVWMISRWPGTIPASDKATQLLKLLGNICLSGACLMLFALLAEKMMAYQSFDSDVLVDPSVLTYLPRIYFGTSVAWLVALFLMKYHAGVFPHTD